MPANTSPIFALTPIVTPVSFVNADGTTKKTIYSPGTNGGRLERVAAATDDSAAVNVNIYITVGGTDYLVGTRQVAAGSGNTADSTSVNLLDAVKNPWVLPDGSIVLPSTAVVKVAPQAAVTAAKTLYVTPFAADF